MIHLVATNETLEILTSSTSQIEYVVEWADNTDTAFTLGNNKGAIASATSTTIVSAPASLTTRRIKGVTLRNAGTTTNVVTLKVDTAGVECRMTPDVPLTAGESLIFSEERGLEIYAKNGVQKTEVNNVEIGRPVAIMKTGTIAEAAGQFYCFAKDAGTPGAYTVGTPGVNGRVTDGLAVADAGSISFPDPTVGSAMYIRDMDISSTVTGQAHLWDFLWINSGLSVTLTTAQTIAMPTLPARDINGSTNGEGVYAGILVTTTMTNAAVVTINISYTNSDGVAGRTGTLVMPITGVIGTFVPFNLAAGDKGIRSIQSQTNVATLTGGAISLVLYRRVMSASMNLINTGSLPFAKNREARVYNRSCLIPLVLCSTTTLHVINGIIYFVEK